MLSRRDLGKKAAAGAAVVLATGVARASLDHAATSTSEAGPALQPTTGETTAEAPSADAPTIQAEAAQAAPAPWELLSPLAVGSTVGHGWSVADLSGEEHGSCVLTLENQNGRQHRVHICRNDGSPQGLVYTNQFDLLVMNGGVGDLPTEEGLAQAVAEVSHVLAANEGRYREVTAKLMPHAERLQLAEAASDCRLR